METSNKIHAWRNHGAVLSLLGTSLLSILLLFAFITRTVPILPNSIPLHFSYEGLVLRYGAPQNLFYLPMIGALIWLFNTITGLVLLRNNDERFMVHLLWTITLIVQIILWITTLRLTNSM